MITQINENNQEEYKALFEKANLELNDYNITNLEVYYKNLLALAKKDINYTRLPLDEGVFEIDANTRTIIVPEEFKGGIGVQGDQIAEILYFKINRYYDMTDLNTKNIYIQWKTPKGEKYLSTEYLRDIESEPDYLIFGCPLDNRITQESGEIEMAISFVGWEDEYEANMTYSLNTQPIKLKIKSGLNITDMALLDSKMSDLVLNNLIYPERIEEEKPIILRDIENERQYLYDPIYIYAISPNGGEIEYQLEINITDTQEQNYTQISKSDYNEKYEYVLTKDIEFNKNKKYYINENGTLATETAGNPSELGLYERVYGVTIKEGYISGRFRFKIINNLNINHIKKQSYIYSSAIQLYDNVRE